MAWSQKSGSAGSKKTKKRGLWFCMPHCLPGLVASTPEDSSSNVSNCQIHFSPFTFQPLILPAIEHHWGWDSCNSHAFLHFKIRLACKSLNIECLASASAVNKCWKSALSLQWTCRISSTDSNTREPGLVGTAKRQETVSEMGRPGDGSYGIQNLSSLCQKLSQTRSLETWCRYPGTRMGTGGWADSKVTT